MGSTATGGRFQFGALIVLTLVASSAGFGLECYCREFHNRAGIPSASCRQNHTCHVSDTSIGQCYVERRTSQDGQESLNYGCFEIPLSEISAMMTLGDLCNTSSGSSLVTQCCVTGKQCNRDIQFVDHSPPTQSSSPATTAPTPPTQLSSPATTAPTSDTTPSGALDSQEDTDWTTGTLVTATLFVLTLVASVAIFSVLCILLRRRAASHSVQVV